MIDYTAANAEEADLSIDAGELRRARLGVKSSRFKLELNTDRSGEIEVTDAYVEFAPGNTNWTIRVGQFKPPGSLDEQTSSRFTTSLERAAFTDAFLFDRRLGAAVSAKGTNWTFVAGAYGGDLNDTPTSEGLALAARYTHVPVQSENALVHVGASVRYTETDNHQSLIRNRQRPFAHLPGRIVSTGPIANSDMFYGLEAAGIFGAAFVAGEVGILTSDGPSGSSDQVGGYIESGVFLGGAKGYKDGKFDRPIVTHQVGEGGLGALALFARIDVLDQSDAAIDGGRLDTMIAGADWYPTRHTRIALNMFHSDATFGATDSGLDPAFAAARARGITGDKVTGALVRIGFDL